MCDLLSDPEAYPGFYNGEGSRGGEPSQRVWGTEVSQWCPGVGGLSPPEAEAKSEISVQFLPFFCKKIMI